MTGRATDHMHQRPKLRQTPPAETPVASPCTNVCRIDAASGWCEGCLRSLDEIAAWSALDEAARRAVCVDLVLRRALRVVQEPANRNVK